MISPSLRDFLGVPKKESDDEVRKELRRRLRNSCKPCWELRYCPYGPLVEDFPLPASTLDEAKEHQKYLKRILAAGKYDDGRRIPADKRRFLTSMVADFDESECVDKNDPVELQMACRIFGHFCPVYFVAEPATETADIRIRTRNIPSEIQRRVARRDNNMCQVCSRPLLDREMEFDHQIPVALGGSSNEHNVRLTCFKCNRKKSKKLDPKFLSENPAQEFMVEMASNSPDPVAAMKKMLNIEETQSRRKRKR